jgi:transcriptional regulator with XRE-family HTH domain
MTFVEMLRAVLAEHELTLVSVAQSLGISTQYLHDLKEGRRLPSVEVVEKICAWMGRGPKGRLEWHMAGAEAHGWKVRS